MRVPVEPFRKALKVVQPAVGKGKAKTTLPILQNVLVQDGRVHATNLELAISAPVRGLEGDAFTVPFGALRDTLSALPGYETVQLTREGPKISLTASRSAYTLSGTEAKEFPPMPDPEGPVSDVNGDLFLEALAAVAPYAATADDRPTLKGVLVKLGEPLEVAAADGFRLAWRRAPPAAGAIAARDGQAEIIIPATAVGPLRATWRAAPPTPTLPIAQGPDEPSIDMAAFVVAPRMMHLAFDDKHLACSFGEVRFVTELIQGTFPNYQQLIPTNMDKRLVVDGGEFQRALRQLAPVAYPGSGIVRLQWQGQELRLSARAEEQGDTEVRLPCHSQGEPGRIAFAIRYLSEYFSDREGPVMLEVTTPSSPALFTWRDEADMVLMPLFVRWDGDTEEAAKAPADAEEEPTEDDEAPANTEEEPAEAERKGVAQTPKRRSKRGTRTGSARV